MARSINNPSHECKRLNLKISINGELYFSCALYVALKSALHGNPKPLPQDQKYIKYLNFEFAKEHFRTAEGANRVVQDGVNDASKAAEQKDAYGSVQSSATDKTAESGGAAEQKRTNSKEAANEKAASKKGADESTGSPLLQKACEFFTEQVAQKGHEDEPISARRRWIEQCLKLGLKDAGLSISTFAKDRSLLGFSGANANGIVCRFEGFDGVFTPDWKYDRDKKAWHVKYAERLWRGMPRDALSAHDNSAEFGNVLVQIRNFASKIGCENFAQTFDNALKTLRGEVAVDEYYAVSFAVLPQPSLRAFAAAGIADVFGAMGSWDDEPPSMAQEIGFGDEYDRLSDELLAQKNSAILFAING
ncbi:hypothetical protein [uncultured Campylobacter sp.]|uniref:hypothetical protein n=1 Tax=uncultured Campylobacter sp. TaxID=218934 RepID=UPI0026240202|nr:hypothetical protein [uncultured Campylobacter sp.]